VGRWETKEEQEEPTYVAGLEQPGGMVGVGKSALTIELYLAGCALPSDGAHIQVKRGVKQH
jgi:hypothetical protein